MKKLVSIMLSMIMALSVVCGTTVFADSNTSVTEEKEMCKIHYFDPFTDYIREGVIDDVIVGGTIEDMHFLTNKSKEVEKGGSYYTCVKFNADHDENDYASEFNVTVVMGDGTVITPAIINKGLISIVIPKVTDDIYINIDYFTGSKDQIIECYDRYSLLVWDLNNVVSDDKWLNKQPQKSGEHLYNGLGTITYSPIEGYEITSIKVIKIISHYDELTGEYEYGSVVCDPKESKNLIDNGDGTYSINDGFKYCHHGQIGDSFYLYINAEPIEKPTTPTKPVVKKTTVSLAKPSANLYVNGTTTVNATVKNGKGATTYKSSNTKVAKVDSKGKVTALKAGTAKITVTNNKVSKTFTVTVRNPKLSKTKLTLKPEKSYTLKITGKIGKATFTSSKKSVVKVNSAGKIVAKKKGKAVITAKTNGITLKCNVVVK